MLIFAPAFGAASISCTLPSNKTAGMPYNSGSEQSEETTMIKVGLALSLGLAVSLGHMSFATAQDDHRSILRELRSVPASAYDVGVLKVEQLMTGLDNAL